MLRRYNIKEEIHKGVRDYNLLESSLDECRRSIALLNGVLEAIMPGNSQIWRFTMFASP
jgi:hypothetical protein